MAWILLDFSPADLYSFRSDYHQKPRIIPGNPIIIPGKKLHDLFWSCLSDGTAKAFANGIESKETAMNFIKSFKNKKLISLLYWVQACVI